MRSAYLRYALRTIHFALCTLHCASRAKRRPFSGHLFGLFDCHKLLFRRVCSFVNRVFRRVGHGVCGLLAAFKTKLRHIAGQFEASLAILVALLVASLAILAAEFVILPALLAALFAILPAESPHANDIHQYQTIPKTLKIFFIKILFSCSQK